MPYWGRDMDGAITRVLDLYHLRMEDESQKMRTGQIGSFDECLLPVGPAVGALLNLLIKEAGAKTLLEIGTSYGYSTIWLAEAARATSGKVISLELQKYKQDYARNALADAGLAGHVEFIAGDAVETLETLDGPFDFVLVDLWKDMYIPCLEAFYPKLRAGALIAADNMIEPSASRHEASEYRRAIRAKPGIQSVLLPVGQGVELSRYAAGLPNFLT
jgi:predicted O-methyltransferase YrrM